MKEALDLNYFHHYSILASFSVERFWLLLGLLP